MLFYFIFSFLFWATEGQTRTNELIKRTGLEVDLDCVKLKIPHFAFIFTQTENCRSNTHEDLLQLPNKLVLKRNMSADVTSYKYCNNNLRHCETIVQDSLNLCLTDSQKNFLKYRLAEENAVLSFVCNHNGQPIRNLFKMDVSKCKVDVHQYNRCIGMKYFTKEIKADEYYTKENCLKRFRVLFCFFDNVKSCDDKTGFKFLRKLMFLKLKATPCSKYVSETSTNSVNYALMLLILMSSYISSKQI